MQDHKGEIEMQELLKVKGLSIQDWLDAGYKQYSVAGHLGNHSAFLQKRVMDCLGNTKYFVDVKVFEHFKEVYLNPSFMPELGYTPEVQFRSNSEDMTVDISLHFGDENTIQEVEEQFESLWNNLGSVYYKKDYRSMDYDLKKEIYEHLCKTIQPYTRAGLLPPSVLQSMDFLLDFYLTSLKEAECETTT